EMLRIDAQARLEGHDLVALASRLDQLRHLDRATESCRRRQLQDHTGGDGDGLRAAAIFRIGAARETAERAEHEGAPARNSPDSPRCPVHGAIYTGRGGRSLLFRTVNRREHHGTLRGWEESVASTAARSTKSAVVAPKACTAATWLI